jgi:hypothetical protein
LVTAASAIYPLGEIPSTWQERRAYASRWTKDAFQKFASIDSEYYAIKRDIYADMAALVSDTLS